MKFTAVIFVLCAVICGCRPPGKPTEADIELKPEQVRDFAQIYNLNCAGCHGQDGKGNSALALANPIYLAIAGDTIISNVTANGRRGTLMPAFAISAGGTLTDEQIEIIVHGMRQRWAHPENMTGPHPPPYAALQPGSKERGAVAYKTFCAGCHGADGRGTARGSSIVDDSYLALVSDQNLRLTIIGGRPDLGQPDWAHCIPGRAMTDADVSDVVAWLAAKRKANPGQPYPGGELSAKENRGIYNG